MNNQDPTNLAMHEQQRLRDRIGFFNKNVDNVMVNAPDQKSSHYMGEDERFNKDFAAVEKKRRQEQYARKQAIIDSRR